LLPGRICSALVFSSFVEEKTYMEIPSIASMHMCITTQIGSSLPDLFTASWSPFHSGLCHFKITEFVTVHQPHSSVRFPSPYLFLPCTSQ
jgi:hypothetical protein